MVATLDWVRLGLRARRTLGEVGKVGYGDAWVELEGCGRWEAFRAVEAACLAEDGFAEALPTTGGVLVRLYRTEEDDPDAWPGRVATLAQRLSTGGRGVHITIPPVSTDTPGWAGAPPFVSACLAWPSDPPAGEGSYRFGRHPEGWPLAPSTTRMVVDEAVDWVLGSDGVGGINEYRPVPATASDAGDLLIRSLPGTELMGWDRKEEFQRRIVCFGSHGLTTWTDVSGTSTRLQAAHQAAERLLRHTEHLVVGFVALTDWPDADPDRQRGPWAHYPQHWSTRVPDAHGIQLLNGSHLALAHNLAGWQIDEVAPDRYLVQALNLADWYDCTDNQQVWRRHFPDPDLVERARSDFGDLLYSDV